MYVTYDIKYLKNMKKMLVLILITLFVVACNGSKKETTLNTNDTITKIDTSIKCDTIKINKLTFANVQVTFHCEISSGFR